MIEEIAVVFDIPLVLKVSTVSSRFLRILIRSSSAGELVELEESVMGIEWEDPMVPVVPENSEELKRPDLSRCRSVS